MERVLLAILRGQPEGRAYRWLIELDHLLRTDPNDGPTPAGALCALADWLEALGGHVPPPAPDSGRDERWQTC